MRIYVGGISYNATDYSLRSLFETVGTVSEANIITDRYTNQSKGFGFVEMPDDTEARAAISKMNGHNLDGRNLLVNEAKPREARPSGDRSRRW
ncbi:MAG: RNA-binding protein [Armatimonadaceae bacterium]